MAPPNKDAQQLGNLNLSPPSTLTYKYPPPNPIILNNISHALANVPRFYVQVLHLMNKMNLPPPFGPPLPPAIVEAPPPVIEKEIPLPEWKRKRLEQEEQDEESDDDAMTDSAEMPNTKRQKLSTSNVIREPIVSTSQVRKGPLAKTKQLFSKIEIRLGTDPDEPPPRPTESST
eukprot:GILK01009268.1.p1 GENE.GILK01009268.1~~GILK01009268.1.p1  ORF type:complete len:187 (+),score=19.37 GILK01009268.1:40-561(+)